MSDHQGTNSAAEAHAQLREQQLVLIHATDQLILDHSMRLSETLRFIITQIGRAHV